MCTSAKSRVLTRENSDNRYVPKPAFTIKPLKHPTYKWVVRAKIDGEWVRKYFTSQGEARTYADQKTIPADAKRFWEILPPPKEASLKSGAAALTKPVPLNASPKIEEHPAGASRPVRKPLKKIPMTPKCAPAG